MAEPFLGEIVLFGGNFAPRSWALCNGQLLSISSNQALFAILGTTYGGDGRTSFALPDLRGRVPLCEGTGPGLTSRNLGARGGDEDVTLTSTQMPTHTHDANLDFQIQGRNAMANFMPPLGPAPGNVLAMVPNVNLYSTSEASLTALGGVNFSAAVENAGGNAPHTNMQPFLALNYIIALQGIFPSRN